MPGSTSFNPCSSSGVPRAAPAHSCAQLSQAHIVSISGTWANNSATVAFSETHPTAFSPGRSTTRDPASSAPLVLATAPTISANPAASPMIRLNTYSIDAK